MIRSRLLIGLALAGALLCSPAVTAAAAPASSALGPSVASLQSAAPAAAPAAPHGDQEPPPPPPPPPAPHRGDRRAAPPPPPPPPPSHAAESEGQAINVQIEMTIREEGGQGSPASKTVTLIAADHESTMVRSSSRTAVPQAVPQAPLGINVDARPEILSGGRVRVNLGLEYAFAGSTGTDAPVWSLNQRMNLILESGRPLVVSRTADPRSGRQAVVEVTATILK